MNKEKLNKMLNDANISRKELAVKLNCATQTINNWGSTQNIPYWVESWLENFIEKKKFENMKNVLRDSGVCDG